VLILVLLVFAFTASSQISHHLGVKWLRLGCLTPLSTTFQLNRGGQFIGGGVPGKHRLVESH